MIPILSLVFSILLFVSGIMLIVKGFKQSTGWGLINLLVPFGIFFFMAKFWDDAKGPAKLFIIALIGYAVCAFMLIGSLPNTEAGSELFQELQSLE